MVAYEIVHKLIDGTETVIGKVHNPAYIRHYVEVPQYPGTWITDTRKLLRFNRGEIYIRSFEEREEQSILPPPQVILVPQESIEETAATIIATAPRQQPLYSADTPRQPVPQGIDNPKYLQDMQPPMMIVDKQFIKWTDHEVCKLTLSNCDEACWLIITPKQVIAYTRSEQELWRYHSFSEMAERFDRHIAYEALQIYIQYLETYGYEGAM